MMNRLQKALSLILYRSVPDYLVGVLSGFGLMFLLSCVVVSVLVYAHPFDLGDYTVGFIIGCICGTCLAGSLGAILGLMFSKVQNIEMEDDYNV